MSSSASHPSQQAIGVFDSGVGGLSVLRQLLRLLPHEHIVYLADAAHAPYGERSSADICQRTEQVVRHLRQHHRIKALVIACNTATAHAAAHLRAAMPELPVIGIEPAIKPAVAQSRSGRIGILATRATLQSPKYQRLLAEHRHGCQVISQPCDGLALAIENALDATPHPDGHTVESLCQRYTAAMQPFATAQAPTQGVDTLVLGCTHYPFALDALRACTGAYVRLIEPGEPVARQTQQVLQRAGLLRTPWPDTAETEEAPNVSNVPNAADATRLTLLCTAAPARLSRAAQQWLGLAHRTAQLEVLENSGV